MSLREHNAMEWDAKLYNDKHSFVYNYGESLIKKLDPKPYERILDLGCGTADLTYQISKITNNCIGIDNSYDMVALAKQQYPELEIYQKDATDFDFDQPFEAIFSNATLHWILDYKSCAESIYRNLKTKGRMVVEFGGKGNIQEIENCLRKNLKKYNYTEQSKFKQWYFPSIADYSKVLEDVGFRVVFAQHYDRPTELVESESGIRDWLAMFGKNFFKDVLSVDEINILNDVQEELRNSLFISGKWYADYKRIRIVAIKE